MKQDSLNVYYEAQTSLLRLVRRLETVSEELKQAKFDLRTAEEKRLNYQQSIKAFLEKLYGRREETEESISRMIRAAEAKKDVLQREREQLTRQIQQLEEKLKSLPKYDRFPREEEWARLESRYCTEVLSVLLEENRKALLEYRSLLRGEYPVLSLDRKQELTSQPNVRAKKCLPYLHRLKYAREVLGSPLPLDGYYEAPDAWLFGVAADHNRRDRVNDALDQVEQLQRILSR